MRVAIFTLGILLSMAAESARPACPEKVIPDVAESEADFTIEDTAGLNVVARPNRSMLRLAESECNLEWPGNQLVINILAGANFSIAAVVKALEAGDKDDRLLMTDKGVFFSKWRVISREPAQFGELKGISLLRNARAAGQGHFVFYNLYLSYQDGYGFLISASGPISMSEQVVARTRRLAASLGRRDSDVSQAKAPQPPTPELAPR